MLDLSYRGSDGCLLHVTLVDSASQPASRAERPVLLMLHAGGPDHQSLIPLARELADRYTVVLPDVRGYGRSVCVDPSRHTWAQYASDVIAVLDGLDVSSAIVGGVGLGTTIALRAAIAYPERIRAAVLISVEDIEDDDKKAAEIEFLDAFAARARTEGIEAAWAPVLPHFPPIVAALVREAIPRADRASIAAAAAIGRDRSFRSVDELAGLAAPVLVIPGIDERHPTALAEQLASLLPRGQLAPVTISVEMHTAEDFARAFAPTIRAFLSTV
jgi:pimeloyl-ACP methyl ester carboxylesterase